MKKLINEPKSVVEQMLRHSAAGLAGTGGARQLQPDVGPHYSVLASIVIALGMSLVYLLVLLALRTPELAAVIDRVRRR